MITTSEREHLDAIAKMSKSIDADQAEVDTSAEDTRLREIALRLAVQSENIRPLEEAKLYYVFLKGED